MKTIFFSLFMTIGLASFAKVEERSASITHKLGGNEKIVLNVKGADVTINSQDVKTIEITGNLIFRGTKKSKEVEELIENFPQSFKEAFNASSAEVNFNISNLTSGECKKYFFGLVQVVNSRTDEFDLNIDIKLPGNQDLVIVHSYGDMKMTGTYANVDLEQFSGDFEGGYFTSMRLTQKYGKSVFGTIETGKLQLFEQDLRLGSSSTLDINAKYSELQIGQSQTISGLGFETDYQIGMLTTLTGNYKYGDFEIGQLKTMDLSVCFEQDFQIGHLENLILKNSKYSDYEIGQLQSIKSELNFEDDFTIGVLETGSFANSKYSDYAITSLGISFVLEGFEDDIKISALSQNNGEITVTGKYNDIEISTSEAPYSAHFELQYGKAQIPNDGSLIIEKDQKTSTRRTLDVKTKNAGNGAYKMSFTGFETDVTIN